MRLLLFPFSSCFVVLLLLLSGAVADEQPLDVNQSMVVSVREFFESLVEEAAVVDCQLSDISNLELHLSATQWRYLIFTQLSTQELQHEDTQHTCRISIEIPSNSLAPIIVTSTMNEMVETYRLSSIERKFSLLPLERSNGIMPSSVMNKRDIIRKLIGAACEKRDVMWRQLSDQNGCSDGKYSQQNKCLSCPSTCKKCTSFTQCSECNADDAVPSRTCFCSDNFHLYTKSEEDTACVRLTTLQSQKKKLCPEGYGFIKMNNKGSFCWKCSSKKCKRCYFNQKSDSQYDSSWNSETIERIIATYYVEKCKKCSSKYEQVSSKDVSTCVSAKQDCKNCSACNTCSQSNKFCLSCDSSFSYLDSKSKQCVTLEGANSYRITVSSNSSPSGDGDEDENEDGEDQSIMLSAATAGVSLTCGDKESKVWNSAESKYECISCDILKCNNCNSADICSSCDTGYILSANHLSCLKCSVTHCEECESTSTAACSVCKSNFTLNPSTKKCDKSSGGSCQDDEYYDTSDSQCKKCPTGCTECDYESGNVTCTDCDSAYEMLTVVSSTQQYCALPCSVGQYRNTTNNLCTACPVGCASCAGGFSQCESCSSAASYYLLSSISSSMFSQRASEYQTLLTSIINGSLPHADQFVTLVSNPNDRCLPLCPNNSYAKIVFLSSRRRRRVLEQKKFFELGNFLSRNQEAVDVGRGFQFTCHQILNCDKSFAFSAKCIQCSAGYYYDSDSGLCSAFPTCSKSYQYFNPVQKKCLVCPVFCSQCSMLSSTFTSPTCTSCIQGAELDPSNQFCKANILSDNRSTTPSCKIDNCLRCTVDRTSKEVCLECTSTAFLLYNQQCYPINNSVTCSAGQYLRYNYTSSTHECENCFQNCAECALVNPYSTTQIPVCSSCNSNYSLSPSGLFCFSNTQSTCPTNQSLQSYGSQFFCSKCDDTCSNGCQDYKPKNWCNSCADGFKKINNTCVTVCPSGSLYSADNKSCDLIETQEDTIVTQLPTQIIQQSAIISCPDTSSYSPTLKTCICNSYLYKFIVDQCVRISIDSSAPNCFSGQFYEASTNSCKTCPYDLVTQNPTCQTCYDSFTCLVCIPGYYLNESTSTCTACPTGCTSCTSSDNCTECNLGKMITFNTVTRKSSCTDTCGDGYLASLDSAYLWNLNSFPSTSYTEFISNIQAEYTSSLATPTSTLPFAIFNQSVSIAFAPSGFTLSGENCTVCPSSYYRNLKTMSCVERCPPEQKVSGQECLSDIINENPIYQIICTSCDPLGNQQQNINENLVLLINGEAYSYLGTFPTWKLEQVEGNLKEFSEKKQTEITALVSDAFLVIENKTKLTLESKYLQANIRFTFSFTYGIGTQQKITIVVSVVNPSAEGMRVRTAAEIGIFPFMIEQSASYFGTHSLLASLDQPEISYFFPPNYFPTADLEISFVVSFLSKGWNITKQVEFKTSFAGQFSLDPYIPFIDGLNDFMRLTFALTSKSTRTTYLITRSIELKFLPVDIEQLLSDMSIDSAELKSAYIELLSHSTFRQMISAELLGTKASLNSRINSSLATSNLYEETIYDTSVTVVDYLSKRTIDLRGVEMNIFDQSSSQNGMIYYKSCSSGGNGYFCKETSPQEIYFSNIIEQTLNKISQMLVDLSVLDSNSLTSLLHSLVFLSRMNQNTSSLVQKYLIILQKIQKQTEAPCSEVMYSLIYILEMSERQKGDQSSSENNQEKSIDLLKSVASNVDQFSLKTPFIQILRSKINLSEFSTTLKLNQSSIVFPQQDGLSNVGFFSSAILQEMLNLTSAKTIGNPITDSLYFNSFHSISNNKYQVKLKLTNSTSTKRHLSQVAQTKFGCWDVISSSLSCDVLSISSDSIQCACSNGEVQLVGLEIEDSGKQTFYEDIRSLIDLTDIHSKSGMILAFIGIAHFILPLLVSSFNKMLLFRSKYEEKNKKAKYELTKKSVLNSQDMNEQTYKLQKVMADVLAHNKLFTKTAGQGEPFGEQPPATRNQTIDINEVLPPVIELKSMSESHFKYEFKCSAVGQTQQLSSLLQIPEQESIIMREEKNAKDLIRLPIKFNCVNIFSAILWGVKRPWNNLYSTKAQAQVCIECMCVILEMGFIISLSKILEDIYINGIIVAIHLVSGLFLRFISRLRFAALFSFLYVCGLFAANYYSLIFTESQEGIPKSDFENWSYTIFLSAIIDEILRTVLSAFTVILFLTNNPCKRIYDYESCLQFFYRKANPETAEGKANSVVPMNQKDVSDKGSNFKFGQKPVLIDPASPTSLVQKQMNNMNCMIEDIDRIEFKEPRKEDTFGQMSPISHNTFMYDFVKDFDNRIRNENRVVPAEYSVKKSVSSNGFRSEEDDNRIGSLRQMKIQKRATFTSKFSKVSFERANIAQSYQPSYESSIHNLKSIKKIQPCRTIDLFSGENEAGMNRVTTPPSLFREFHLGKQIKTKNSLIITNRKKRPDHFSVDNQSATHSVNQHNKRHQFAEKKSFDL